MRQYATAHSMGNRATDREIVLFIYGPKGGLRATEVLSVQGARDLIAALRIAVNKLEPEDGS